MDRVADRLEAGASPGLAPRSPRVLSLLSVVHGIVGTTRPGRAFLRALQVRYIARAWLRAAVLNEYRHLPDDITVVIGIRDRSDHRLALALRSIRDQTYPADQVLALVVDYGSEPGMAELTAQLCRELGAAYLRVETNGVWSRSRCLNIGIRRATTKYLMTSDADSLLSPGYIAEAVNVLRGGPLSLVCAPMLDLPENSADVLRATAEGDGPLPLHDWKTWGTPRLGWKYHPSLTVTYTAFHRLIQGYDEFYELWGSEDVDLWRRLSKLGLDHRVLDSREAFYLHQWHPKYENTADDARESAIRRNGDYYRRVQTILRNGPAWGRGVEPFAAEYPSRTSGAVDA